MKKNNDNFIEFNSKEELSFWLWNVSCYYKWDYVDSDNDKYVIKAERIK